jgi:hypothetical protein
MTDELKDGFILLFPDILFIKTIFIPMAFSHAMLY